MKEKRCVISLGGSLIIPDGKVNTGYLKDFTEMISLEVANGQSFGIVTGGGSTCRTYQKGLKEGGVIEPDVLDEVGIDTTHLNAKVLHHILRASGIHSQYIRNLQEAIEPESDTVVTGGTKVGQTSDGAMIEFSKILGAKQVINATNITHVFECENGVIDRTRPIKSLTWDEYLTKIPATCHTPGENLPFGYTASQQAKELGISVAVVGGENIGNLRRCIERKPFIGTLIRKGGEHGV
jgi:uridylate kinase